MKNNEIIAMINEKKKQIELLNKEICLLEKSLVNSSRNNFT